VTTEANAEAVVEREAEVVVEETAEVADASAGAPEATPAVPGLSPADCARELAQRFPALFDGPARPLKLRIQADIQARAPGVFSRSVLSAFLRRLTGSTAYLNALSRAPQRIDLDGQPAGEISDEHRQIALEELARRRALRQERRVAEGGGPPARPGRGPRPPRGAEGQGAAPSADGVAPAPQGPAADRPPRGPRRDGAPRPDGAPRREGGPRRDAAPRDGQPRRDGPRPDAPRRDARPPRPDQRPDQRPEQRADARPPRPDQRPPRRPDDRRPAGDRPREDRRPDPRAQQRPEAAEARIEDPERRQRARLLREWESTSLTRANFCVLRGVPEAQFDALLAQARAEAGERTPPAMPHKPRG
jgi:hypothetical protein